MNFLIYSSFNKDNGKQITELQRLKELVDAIRTKPIKLEELPQKEIVERKLEKELGAVAMERKQFIEEQKEIEPAKIVEKKPVQVIKKEPIPEIIKKEPVIVTKKEPIPEVIKKEPVIVTKKEPIPEIIKKEPVIVTKKEPVTVVKKEPIPEVIKKEPVVVPLTPEPIIATVTYIDLKNMLDNYNNFMYIVYELYNGSIRSYNKHFGWNLKELKHDPIKLEPTVVPYIDAVDQLHQNLVNNVNQIYDKLPKLFFE